MKAAVPRYSALMRWVGLPLARLVALPLLAILGPVRTRDKNRVPRSGGLLILANHISDLDPVAVQYCCPRPIHFMAKEELFRMRGLGWLIRRFRAFPVRRGEPDREAIKTAVAILAQGEVVCVFPEGQLSEDGQLQPLKPGIALIARMAKCPVQCCGIVGTNRIMPYGMTKPRRARGGPVECRWGEARDYDSALSAEDWVAWAEAELRRLTA